MELGFGERTVVEFNEGRDRPPGGLANGKRMYRRMESLEISSWSIDRPEMFYRLQVVFPNELFS
jgi:hypothetical protein